MHRLQLMDKLSSFECMKGPFSGLEPLFQKVLWPNCVKIKSAWWVWVCKDKVNQWRSILQAPLTLPIQNLSIKTLLGMTYINEVIKAIVNQTNWKLRQCWTEWIFWGVASHHHLELDFPGTVVFFDDVLPPCSYSYFQSWCQRYFGFHCCYYCCNETVLSAFVFWA